MGLWDRQDPGTTPRSGNPRDIPGTPNGTVGQTGSWDNSKEWESLRYPRDSQQDCGTDRILGQLQGVGVIEIPQGLPVGLWDRQDPGTTPKSGSPRDIPGIPGGTVHRTDRTLGQFQGSSGYPRDSQWDYGTDRTLGQLQGVGVLRISQALPAGLWETGPWENNKEWESLG